MLRGHRSVAGFHVAWEEPDGAARLTVHVDGSYLRLLDAIARRHQLTRDRAAVVALHTLLTVEDQTIAGARADWFQRGRTRPFIPKWETDWRIGPPAQEVSCELTETALARVRRHAGERGISPDQVMQAAIDTASELDHLDAQGWTLRLRPRLLGRTRMLSMRDLVAGARALEPGVEAPAPRSVPSL